MGAPWIHGAPGHWPIWPVVKTALIVLGIILHALFIYSWLICQNDKLGCSFCKDTKIIYSSIKGVHLAGEWIEAIVSAKNW